MDPHKLPETTPTAVDSKGQVPHELEMLAERASGLVKALSVLEEKLASVLTAPSERVKPIAGDEDPLCAIAEDIRTPSNLINMVANDLRDITSRVQL
jgi:hypothetical protein